MTTAATRTLQIGIFYNEKQQFCTLCRCAFQFYQRSSSFYVLKWLVLPSCLEEVSNWRQIFIFFSWPAQHLSYLLNSRIFGPHLPAQRIAIIEKWLQKRQVIFLDDVLGTGRDTINERETDLHNNVTVKKEILLDHVTKRGKETDLVYASWGIVDSDKTAPAPAALASAANW